MDTVYVYVSTRNLRESVEVPRLLVQGTYKAGEKDRSPAPKASDFDAPISYGSMVCRSELMREKDEMLDG